MKKSVREVGGASVVALVELLYAEFCAELYERTRYQYRVLGLSKVFENETTLAPTEAIWANVPGVPALSGARSIRNPVSLFALSVHDKSMPDEDVACACRLVGAAGGSGGVVALTCVEYADTSRAVKSR